jgi:hypothetical protein
MFVQRVARERPSILTSYPDHLDCRPVANSCTDCCHDPLLETEYSLSMREWGKSAVVTVFVDDAIRLLPTQNNGGPGSLASWYNIAAWCRAHDPWYSET